MNANRSIPNEIWQKGGVTEHLGSSRATQRMLARMGDLRGQRVLDIGCGTGYTACWLAKNFGARVIAMDLNLQGLAQARQRILDRGLIGAVRPVQADAHGLPFAGGSFHAVIIESVLVFCSAGQVMAEVRRVLKPGGVFGGNELTLTRPAPQELKDLLVEMLGIRTQEENEWRKAWEDAGFKDVRSSLHHLKLYEQMLGHLQVDGVQKYLKALRAGLKTPGIRAAFFNRRMLEAALKFISYIGYGIYTGRKDLSVQ